ncbi:MAG: biosynthetic-type acetolactate synthase large subunit [Deltaproteobacteria bacterium]|jgi:acetolactate synthase I/II/III large subunit|nr:biosynthetic-type acetolactate synthase large subunit [Deltaproteobacteria bacterium]MBT4088115.1 biosynthetic-type acetolactate synthase large subunit [Deltaproteobacteria bacterium]MBT4268401.1 biosynthetic-type acetolactate synthase large subunit [Deltaproteobacteria bacterium]MBT4637684.1 biosynthetic-type acetolactate synthase large subunit [Deltaproteobacteria bacterium]MBT6503930.1 biosynthetic-type acetolactate synthase large subunit [Deltaproteobacteria bacterium]
MKGTELVLKALVDNGVTYVFGYTGGAIMPIFDEMEKQKVFTFVMSRHEQGAAFMAQGISRASLSTAKPMVGVCMATSGPGAMNLVTGIADALMDSVPILAITGQVASTVIATDAFQESDVVGVMMPLTKQCYMPLSVEEIEETIHEAFYISKTGRGGPVVIDIPKDIQIQTTAQTYQFNAAKYEPDLHGFKYSPEPDSTLIKKAVAMINKSECPIILCGHGVVASNAGRNLKAFAEKAHVPIGFTLHGLSAIPVDHPLSLGMVGMHGSVEANRALQHTDLMISFGMRFDDRVTGDLKQFGVDVDVIHVEIDPSEINKNVKTSIAINADANRVLKLLAKDPEINTKPRRLWFEQLDVYRGEIFEEVQKEIEKGVGQEGQLLMKTIVKRLSDVTEGKDLIVSDVGQHQMILARFYNFQTTNSWFNSGGAGTMGCALPMSVGVKLARPEERVWAVCGDGGFQMNIQELGSIMEHEIDVKILLLNNGYLGMVRQWQTMFYSGRFAGTPLKNPNFGAIAGAYSIPYQRVETPDQIMAALETAAAHQGAYMVEFLCDPSEIVLPMVPAGGSIADMIVSLNQE